VDGHRIISACETSAAAAGSVVTVGGVVLFRRIDRARQEPAAGARPAPPRRVVGERVCGDWPWRRGSAGWDDPGTAIGRDYTYDRSGKGNLTSYRHDV
jgi:hypothetical protein